MWMIYGQPAGPLQHNRHRFAPLGISPVATTSHPFMALARAKVNWAGGRHARGRCRISFAATRATRATGASELGPPRRRQRCCCSAAYLYGNHFRRDAEIFERQRGHRAGPDALLGRSEWSGFVCIVVPQSVTRPVGSLPELILLPALLTFVLEADELAARSAGKLSPAVALVVSTG